MGKSFLAGALAQKACRDGYWALNLRAAALLRDLGLAGADGSLRHLLARLSRIDCNRTKCRGADQHLTTVTVLIVP